MGFKLIRSGERVVALPVGGAWYTPTRAPSASPVPEQSGHLKGSTRTPSASHGGILVALVAVGLSGMSNSVQIPRGEHGRDRVKYGER